MRLRCRLAAGVTAVAAALVPAAAEAVAPRPGHRAACSAPASADFPVRARMGKGPDVYYAGGGYGRWSLRLVNTTGGSCERIHPVVVLVDRKGKLRPGQAQLEFRAGGRWRAVTFEGAGRGENVGVLDDGARGFTVRPGEPVSVPLRLAFTSDAASDRVVASAAVVQRRGGDGDWVGESDDYPFQVVGDGGARPSPAELARTGPSALLALSATAAALLLTGATLMAAARRLPTRPR
ncbi:hypothetical protein [Streptomyces sp. AN091965]|uniref:hypothetical protein n=1 Tax=Streptomyces sp. AN091965 TaxID=2927803 RepID=UPI001F61661B|nr:hypothetical protein [Streptomyces sp. AN091965]MCI3930907.1 hypothetical protein [Streptomyces sp. AN091965]